MTSLDWVPGTSSIAGAGTRRAFSGCGENPRVPTTRPVRTTPARTVDPTNVFTTNPLCVIRDLSSVILRFGGLQRWFAPRMLCEAPEHLSRIDTRFGKIAGERLIGRFRLSP